MILRRVKFCAVSYCSESCDFSVSFLRDRTTRFSSCFFHNLRLPGPLSKCLKYLRFWLRFRRVIRFFLDWLMILPRVTLYCVESRATTSNFSTGLLRDSVIKTNIYLDYAKKGLQFSIMQKWSRLKFFLTQPSMILCWVSFFDIKLWISWRKRNQIRKYFNQLVSGPGWFEWWKQLGVENLVGLSL